MPTTVIVFEAPVTRRGDWWDAPGRRRYALFQVDCPVAPFALGEGVFPPHDDLPYLMVVDTVHRTGPCTWLVRLVAHDIDAPPTLYALDQRTTPCSSASPPKT